MSEVFEEADVSKTFAFVVDEVVVGTLKIPSTAPNYERFTSGLSLDPKVVDATSFPGVRAGWVYSNGTFAEASES